jgi:hypothetical protein
MPGNTGPKLAQATLAAAVNGTEDAKADDQALASGRAPRPAGFPSLLAKARISQPDP